MAYKLEIDYFDEQMQMAINKYKLGLLDFWRI